MSAPVVVARRRADPATTRLWTPSSTPSIIWTIRFPSLVPLPDDPITPAWGTSNTPVPGAGTSTRVPLILTEYGASYRTSTTATSAAVLSKFSSQIMSPSATPVSSSTGIALASPLVIPDKPSSVAIATPPSRASPNRPMVIVGAVLGSVLGSVLLLGSALLFWRLRRRRRRHFPAQESTESIEDERKGPLGFSEAAFTNRSIYEAPHFSNSKSTLYPGDSASAVGVRHRGKFGNTRRHPFMTKSSTLREETECLASGESVPLFLDESAPQHALGRAQGSFTARSLISRPGLLRRLSEPTSIVAHTLPELTESILAMRAATLKRLEGLDLDLGSTAGSTSWVDRFPKVEHLPRLCIPPRPLSDQANHSFRGVKDDQLQRRAVNQGTILVRLDKDIDASRSTNGEDGPEEEGESRSLVSSLIRRLRK